MKQEGAIKQTKALCPICRKSMVNQYRPFCSERCKMVDLGRWLNEEYVIPTEEAKESPLPQEPLIQDEKQDEKE